MSGDGPETIAVGVALTTDPEATRGKLETFCSALSAATGRVVVPRGLWHYHHLLEGLRDGELHLVWLPPVLALRAAASGHCAPIALPVRHGVSTYSTALFTRPDGPIRALADLRGARAAWVDRQSAAGYLIIRAFMRSKGIDLQQAFAHEKFLGAHDAVAAAVLDGEVDVGATFVYLDPDASTGAPRAAGWGNAPVHVICHAGPIPSDVVATGPALDAGTRALVQDALVGEMVPALGAAARALMGADRFIAPEEVHVKLLLEILENLEDARPAARAIFPSRHDI